MAKRPVRVDLAELEPVTIGDGMAAIAAFLGVPLAEDAARAPAVSGFLEMLAAARSFAEYRGLGYTRDAAMGEAAKELDISPDTLRTRYRAARAAAFGTATKRLKSNLPPGRRAA